MYAETVLAVWIHEDTLVELQLVHSGRPAIAAVQDPTDASMITVSTTADHPFWNHTDQQWQPAAPLDAGERLITADGTDAIVIGVLPYTEQQATAYNLTTTNTHTYYVLAGDTPVLVHNQGGDDRISGTIARGSHEMTIQIYANDHGPPHAHLKGSGFDIQIGQNGKPLDLNVQLNSRQQQFVDDNLKTLWDSVRAKMREHNRNRSGC